MRKFIILSLFVFVPILSFAQERVVYCVTSIIKSGENKFYAVADAGNDIFKGEIVNENNKTRYFKSEGEILNYFAAQGWELVSAYYSGGTFHYLKKKVKDVSEAKNGLQIEEKKEKEK